MSARLLIVALLVALLGADSTCADAPPSASSPAAAMLMDVAMDLARSSRFEGALCTYGRVTEQWPGSREAFLACYAGATLQRNLGQTAEAFAGYQHILETCPEAGLRGRALARQADLAAGLVSPESPDLLHPGERPHRHAVRYLELVLMNDPDGPESTRIIYHLGLAHEQMGNVPVALGCYERLLGTGNRGPWSERALFAVARCRYRASSRAPDDLGAASDASGLIRAFLGEYPGGDRMAAAEGMLTQLEKRMARVKYRNARYYDKIEKNRAAALETYSVLIDRFPETQWARAARERVKAMREDALPLRLAVTPSG